MITREKKKVKVKKTTITTKTKTKKTHTQIKELRQLTTCPGDKMFMRKLGEKRLRIIKRSSGKCRPVLVT